MNKRKVSEEAKKTKKVSGVLLTAAAVSILLALSVSLGVLYKLFFEGAEERMTVEIPNFIEKSIDSIEQDGFDVEIYSVYTDRGGGDVVSQEPSAGSRRKISEGEKIKLRLGVSAEQEKLLLPDLVGFEEREAEIMLRRLGLEVSEKRLGSGLAENGCVVSSAPLPRSRLVSGDRVVLYIADDKCEYSAEVPNLSGMSLKEAKEEAEARGFEIGKISFELSGFFENSEDGSVNDDSARACDRDIRDINSDDESAKIIRQSPPSGVWARRGAVIDLTLADEEL